MKKFDVAVIPGDGIGREVIPEGIKILETLTSYFDFEFTWSEFDWSCEHYAKTGKMMPDGGMDQIAKKDAIYLGAVGFPGVPDHISLWGLLIPIRRALNQYVNLRPVRLFKGVPCPLAGRKAGDIDLMIVRENNEGEYSEIGGRIFAGTDDEIVSQQSVFTRKGVDRILHYAFNLAQARTKKHVTSATKSNGIVHTMPFWDERFNLIRKKYPEIKADQYHIDILTANFVLHPDWFDVVVGSNLFGDILSDLAPAIAGTIGIAASANINPEGDYPSMFEPVHGSAPDIAGKKIANPIAAIWSAAMMMENLGEQKAADYVLKAIEIMLEESIAHTPDMGGKAKTSECGDALASVLEYILR